MEVLPADKQNLEKLLDVFGSVVSLQDIAFAYSQSGGDLDDAANILYNLQSVTSKASPSSSTLGEELVPADTSPSNDSLEKAIHIKSKQKKTPASMGTVSGIIGKEYVRPRPSTKESWKVKPVKLNSNDTPMSEIWDERDSSISKSDSEALHEDIVEFLFKMLGDGFQLERSVIQDIVGQCGYDVEKSMEKLLDLSASTFENSDDIQKGASEIPTKNYLDLEYKHQDDQFRDSGSSGSSNEEYNLHKESLGAIFTVPEKFKEQEKSHLVKQVWKQKASDLPAEEPLKETTINHLLVTKNVSQLPDEKEVPDLQKEVLGSLFTAPERSEKRLEKSRPVKGVRRPRAFGQLVEEPPKETTIEHQSVISIGKTMKNDDEENGDNYDALRKKVMEYWSTAKVYYKYAIDAFVKQDHEKAQKLLKEGQFFMEKAREADERSAQRLLERNDEEEMLVDVCKFDPDVALRHLKLQLNTLPGISSFKHLKVLTGSNDENTKHGLRKRKIIKLLVRENIKWVEEGDGWTIVIPLADVDPKKLSFAKKVRSYT